jgi:hypothetical protein
MKGHRNGGIVRFIIYEYNNILIGDWLVNITNLTRSYRTKLLLTNIDILFYEKTNIISENIYAMCIKRSPRHFSRAKQEEV